jgi:hypothetical protein
MTVVLLLLLLLLLLDPASVDHNRVHIADAVVLLLLLNLDVAGVFPPAMTPSR